MKPNLAAGFIKANDAVDFMRRQRVTEFLLTDTAFRAVKAPEGLMVHGNASFRLDGYQVGSAIGVAQGAALRDALERAQIG
jgi:hypothetical protein